jgi:hypothetical protein
MVQAWLIFFSNLDFCRNHRDKIAKRPGIDKYVNWGKACIFAVIGVKLAPSISEIL